jgi:hypothetical protein
MKKLIALSLLCSMTSFAQTAVDNLKKEAAKVEAKVGAELKKAEADKMDAKPMDPKKVEEAKKAEALKAKKDPAPPGGAAAPAAPAVAAPTMPEPSKELAAAFADLIKKKNLNCKSKVAEGMMGPAYETGVKQSFSYELNNFFISSTYEEKKSKANAKPYASKSVITFDSMKKNIVRSDFDNMGGIGHFTSPGWEGDKLVFTGKMMSGMELRDTFVKGAKEWTELVETKGPDGKWMTMVENTCK